ncbi:MAG: ThuA domain-containing protein [Rhodospirillaceae bacterium]|nr:MAG: ThuA domain-containing protein [Rhodospirillaceae bacterium]
MADRSQLHLVVGGKYHDFNFARLELLKLLAEHDDANVTTASSYADIEHLTPGGGLVTYTCDVQPSEAQVTALGNFLSAGGRWFALHGTNSAIRWLDGRPDCPDVNPALTDMLGSQFRAHPPIHAFDVHVVDRAHDLTKGLRDFRVEDELYLSTDRPGNRPLLVTQFGGDAKPFTQDSWPHAERLVMYLRTYGKGEVLYLTLGHCRGKYDLQPMIEETTIQRCSWQSPLFYEIVRRGLRWALGKPAL